jgi:ribosomal protein S18 acetylase RimI-like enzyme
MIRPARADDQMAVEAIVRAAYSMYMPRIGKPPGPMLDDYGALIRDGSVSVCVVGDDFTALIVLIPKPDHLLLDNIAVAPGHQGRGIGRELVAFAEREARRLGYDELRLYTHVTMTENIALYRRLGFAETHRGQQAGYDRVFMAKRV